MSSELLLDPGERVIIAVSPTIPSELTSYRPKYWDYPMLDDIDRYVAKLVAPFTENKRGLMDNIEAYYSSGDYLGGMGLLPHVNDDPNGAISYSRLHCYQTDDGMQFTPDKILRAMLSEFTSGSGASSDKSRLRMVLVSSNTFRQELLQLLNTSTASHSTPKNITPEIYEDGQVHILRLGNKAFVDKILGPEDSNKN